MAIWLDPKMTWEAKPTGRRLLVVAVFSPKVAIEISPVVSGRANQVKGLREIVFIHDLRRQGLSISAIARKVGSDRKTVRKYLEQGLEVPS